MPNSAISGAVGTSTTHSLVPLAKPRVRIELPSNLRRYGLIACIGGAWIVFLCQLAIGTDFRFSALVFLFHLLTIWCVRICGGLSDLIGCMVAYLAGQSVVVGQVAKVILNERPDTPLMTPILTMTVMCYGMFGLLVGSAIYRQLHPKSEPRISLVTEPKSLDYLSAVCLMLNLGLMAYMRGNTGEGVAFAGLMGLVTVVGLLGIVSAVGSQLIRSGGQKSLSLMTGLSIAPYLYFGILGAGRQAMTNGLLLYVLGALAFGVRPTIRQVLALSAIAVAFNQVLFPFALYARGHGARGGDQEKAVTRTLSLLGQAITNPSSMNTDKAELVDPVARSRRHIFSYYHQNHKTLERYSILPTIDAMVETVSRSRPWGFNSILPALTNAVPGFLRPAGLVNQAYENVASWRIQELQPNDHRTGLTIGFIPDAYSAFGMFGVVIVPALIIYFITLAYRWLIPTRMHRNIFACALFPTIGWPFSEKGIGSQINAVFPHVFVFYIIFSCLLFLSRVSIKSTESLIHQVKPDQKPAA